MTFAEERLLIAAEQAATKCGLCELYGHRAADCPTLEPLLARETKLWGRTYSLGIYAEARAFSWWRVIGLAVMGFCAGVAAMELWKGLSQ